MVGGGGLGWRSKPQVNYSLRVQNVIVSLFSCDCGTVVDTRRQSLACGQHGGGPEVIMIPARTIELAQHARTVLSCLDFLSYK